MSIIDYTKAALSPYVWRDRELIAPIRALLLGLIKQHFPGYQDAYIVGSITTPNWSKHSDIDLSIVYPDSVDIKPLERIASALSEQHLKPPHAPHNIGFYVRHRKDIPDDISKSVGAYNIIRNEWVKEPTPLRVDPRQHEKAFQEKIRSVDIGLNELKRDMRDIDLIIEAFRQVPPNQQLQMLSDLEAKKKEIEDDLRVLTEQYEGFKKDRLKAFEKELERNPDSGKKHLLNQTLEGNVVFKMMERYGYRNLLEKLRDIYKSMAGST